MIIFRTHDDNQRFNNMENVLAEIWWTIKFILEMKGLDLSEHRVRVVRRRFCTWMRLMIIFIDLINNNKNGQFKKGFVKNIMDINRLIYACEKIALS